MKCDKIAFNKIPYHSLYVIFLEGPLWWKVTQRCDSELFQFHPLCAISAAETCSTHVSANIHDASLPYWATFWHHSIHAHTLGLLLSCKSYRLCWLLASKQSAKPVWHIPIAACRVIDSWWWTEKLSETCRILFQKYVYIWEISASRWFYYKNISRCTVLWMSKSCWWLAHILPITLVELPPLGSGTWQVTGVRGHGTDILFCS